MMRRLVLALIAALPVGCASSAATRSLGDRVDPGLVSAFPEEGRRWTYEAENEVIIALDRLDAARDRHLAAEAEVTAADRAIEIAGKRGGQGREVAEARRTMARAEVDHAESEILTAELGVFCARANLELTKARLAVRFDLPVEADYVEKFEEQYDSCAGELTEAREEAEKQSNEAIGAKEKWREVRAEFVRRTGDHNHGLWID